MRASAFSAPSISLLLAIALAGCGGGNSTPSSGSQGTATNPIPVLISVSPSTVAAGSPSTTVTVMGTNFVSTSQVQVGGTAVQTTFQSATQISANLPANFLAAATVAQISVSNPSPGGGSSATAPLTIVTVASFAVLAVPQLSGAPGGAWSIAAAAVDLKANPIIGLPVSFTASSGTIGTATGVTDSIGAFSTTLTPTSGSSSSQIGVLSAVTGGQVATAVLSFSMTPGSDQRAAYRKKRSSRFHLNEAELQTSDSTVTYYSYPISIGGSGNAGSTNAFANSASPACYSSAVLSGGAATPADCQLTYAADHASISFTNLQTVACKADTIISGAEGVANCVGAVAIPVACALATPTTGGLDDLVCGGVLTVPETGFATSCVESLVGLFAQSQLVDQILGLSDSEVDIADCATDDISSCVNAGLDVVGVYCTATSAPPPPSPICAPGSTCAYVINSVSNTMSVFDTAGISMNVPSNAFPSLNLADGLVFDPDTGYLYATNIGSKSVTIYDLSGNLVTLPGAFSNLSSSGDPEDITFDAVSGTFLINDATSNQIYAYDENGNATALLPGAFANINGPYGIVWNAANNTIYVSNAGSNIITAYNPSGMQVTLPGSFSGLSSPDDFIVDPVNGNMYVTEAETDEFGNCIISGVAEFDLNGNTIIPSGGFGTVNCPDSIALLGTSGVGTPELLYVTNVGGNSVTVYDQEGNDLTSQVAPGGFQGLSGPTGIVIVTTPTASPNPESSTSRLSLKREAGTLSR